MTAQVDRREIGKEKDDAEWLHNSAVKAQMNWIHPSFSEATSCAAAATLVDLDETGTTHSLTIAMDEPDDRD